MNITHRIVSMKRGTTKNSASPMWRCQTDSGEKVNVFEHRDPEKNSYLLFRYAGYAGFMDDMVVDEEILWNTFPIAVTLYKKGEWYEITEVADIQPDATPDTSIRRDPALAKAAASVWAYRLLHELAGEIVIWDSETTGTLADDEILTLAGIHRQGVVAFSHMIKPQNMDRIERLTHVHGLQRGDLEQERPFPEVYPFLVSCLEGKIWVIYNASFDSRMLEQVCTRHHLEPILPLATVDAMEMVAMFFGDWDDTYQRWKNVSLSEAAARLEVEVGNAHHALSDAETTLKVIRCMATYAVWEQE